MTHDTTKNVTVHEAADRVVRRLTLARWFAILKITSLPLFLAAAAGFLALRLAGMHAAQGASGLALVTLWLAMSAAWAWWRRPQPVAALALWDQRCGRHEMFASAYCFEGAAGEPPHEAGQLLHVRKARRELTEHLAELNRDLPARFSHRAWLAPLLFLALAASPFLRPTLAREDRPLDPAARLHAQALSQDVLDQADAVPDPEGLDAQEQKELEQIKEDLADTSHKLEQLGKATPREILTELERRARDAEQLAQKLKGADADVSSDMIAELERHADTADLASALRGKDLEKVAEEAEKLAERLRRKDLTLEEAQRIENALKQGLQKATAADRQGLVGRGLSQALQHLQRQQRGLAGRQLANLSRQFRRAALRQQAQRQLQQLARNLRNAGQRLGGGQQMLRQLARQPQGGLQPLTGRRLPPLRLAARQTGPMGLPGGAQRGLVSGQTGTPVPGGPCPHCGSGQCQGQCQGGGSGGSPVPGGGGGRGGTRAGRGTAALGGPATARLKASETSVVGAAPTGDGPSAMRQIDAGPHGEETDRDTRNIAVEFIKTEEEALSAEPLPLSRREQVLRYFTELRRQLEQQP